MLPFLKSGKGLVYTYNYICKELMGPNTPPLLMLPLPGVVERIIIIKWKDNCLPVLFRTVSHNSEFVFHDKRNNNNDDNALHHVISQMNRKQKKTYHMLFATLNYSHLTDRLYVKIVVVFRCMIGEWNYVSKTICFHGNNNKIR